MFFNALSDAIDRTIPSRQKPKAAARTGKPVVQSNPLNGPSKDPATMAATAAAKKRADAFLAAKPKPLPR